MRHVLDLDSVARCRSLWVRHGIEAWSKSWFDGVVTGGSRQAAGATQLQLPVVTLGADDVLVSFSAGVRTDSGPRFRVGFAPLGSWRALTEQDGCDVILSDGTAGEWLSGADDSARTLRPERLLLIPPFVHPSAERARTPSDRVCYVISTDRGTDRLDPEEACLRDVLTDSADVVEIDDATREHPERLWRAIDRFDAGRVVYLSRDPSEASFVRAVCNAKGREFYHSGKNAFSFARFCDDAGRFALETLFSQREAGRIRHRLCPWQAGLRVERGGVLAADTGEWLRSAVESRLLTRGPAPAEAPGGRPSWIGHRVWDNARQSASLRYPAVAQAVLESQFGAVIGAGWASFFREAEAFSLTTLMAADGVAADVRKGMHHLHLFLILCLGEAEQRTAVLARLLRSEDFSLPGFLEELIPLVSAQPGLQKQGFAQRVFALWQDAVRAEPALRETAPAVLDPLLRVLAADRLAFSAPGSGLAARGQIAWIKGEKAEGAAMLAEACEKGLARDDVYSGLAAFAGDAEEAASLWLRDIERGRISNKALAELLSRAAGRVTEATLDALFSSLRHRGARTSGIASECFQHLGESLKFTFFNPERDGAAAAVVRALNGILDRDGERESGRPVHVLVRLADGSAARNDDGRRLALQDAERSAAVQNAFLLWAFGFAHDAGKVLARLDRAAPLQEPDLCWVDNVLQGALNEDPSAAARMDLFLTSHPDYLTGQWCSAWNQWLMAAVLCHRWGYAHDAAAWLECARARDPLFGLKQVWLRHLPAAPGRVVAPLPGKMQSALATLEKGAACRG